MLVFGGQGRKFDASFESKALGCEMVENKVKSAAGKEIGACGEVADGKSAAGEAFLGEAVGRNVREGGGEDDDFRWMV